MPKSKLVSAVALAAACAVGVGAVDAQETVGSTHPNIVFILTDNLGYGDLGVYGGVRGAPTPRIDALAAEGLRFTNFNVEPECTPSRSAMMTGRLPIRSGTSNVVFGGLPEGLAPWEYTLAELLDDAGYQSALFGKWHLGDLPGRFPTDQGFDEWWGFAHSSDATLKEVQPGWTPEAVPLDKIFEGRKGSPTTVVGDYTFAMRPLIDEIITGKATSYIAAHAHDTAPFFLFVPFSNPHSPPIPNPKFDDHALTNYQNVLREIDANTGQILDAIGTAGIENDTVVVFASDNGPESLQGPGIIYGAQGDSGPFRAEFPSGWEGAIRTAGMIRWPGHIPPGRVSNEIFSMLDFYRTFADIAGASDRVPTDRAIDSVDQTDFLLGKQEVSNRNFALFFHSGELLAVKWSKFKIHLMVRVPADGAVRQAGQGVTNGYSLKVNYPWIFNVDDDPKELWNINTSSAWVAVAAAKPLLAYKASLDKYPNLMPGGDGPQTATVPDDTPDKIETPGG